MRFPLGVGTRTLVLAFLFALLGIHPCNAATEHRHVAAHAAMQHAGMQHAGMQHAGMQHGQMQHAHMRHAQQLAGAAVTGPAAAHSPGPGCMGGSCSDVADRDVAGDVAAKLLLPHAGDLAPSWRGPARGDLHSGPSPGAAGVRATPDLEELSVLRT